MIFVEFDKILALSKSARPLSLIARRTICWMGLLIAVIFCAAGPVLAQNNPPEVSNVTSAQRQDVWLVDISFDLTDTDGDACTVAVLASTDGGSTWLVPVTAVTGDVGSGIQPGTGKQIVWNPAVDIPGESGSNYRVLVCADDGHTPVPSGMVLIPAGEYQMGDHHDGMTEALPVHLVYIDAFALGTCEVTNQEYAAALNWAWTQGGLINVSDGVVYRYGGTTIPYCSTTSAPSGSPHFGEYSRISWSGSTFAAVSGKADHPMVVVSWYGAAAYSNWRSGMEGLTPSYDTTTWACNFASSGYRLPTEAEWEKAARGGLYSPYRRYPWGDSIITNIANYSSSGDPYETGAHPWTTPVAFYDGALHYKEDFGWPGSQTTYQTSDGENGWGLYDMAGDVCEWCNDWYGATYYSSSPYSNPQGPASGSCRIMRGGTCYHIVGFLRCAYRSNGYDVGPGGRGFDGGFRLALASHCGDSNVFEITYHTVWVAYTCQPSSGTVPFVTRMTATLTNIDPQWFRRLAGRIDVDLAGGQSFSNWRSGYTNLFPGESYVRTWHQSIPAEWSLIGENVFQLLAVDVTPSPWNQPPYPTAGDTDTAACTVTGIAP